MVFWEIFTHAKNQNIPPYGFWYIVKYVWDKQYRIVYTYIKSEKRLSYENIGNDILVLLEWKIRSTTGCPHFDFEDIL